MLNLVAGTAALAGALYAGRRSSMDSLHALASLFGAPQDHLDRALMIMRVLERNPNADSTTRLVWDERAKENFLWAREQIDLDSEEQENEIETLLRAAARSPMPGPSSRGRGDPRNPPAGWSINIMVRRLGGAVAIRSLGGGEYTAMLPSGEQASGSGNVIGRWINQRETNFYEFAKLNVGGAEPWTKFWTPPSSGVGGMHRRRR